MLSEPISLVPRPRTGKRLPDMYYTAYGLVNSPEPRVQPLLPDVTPRRRRRSPPPRSPARAFATAARDSPPPRRRPKSASVKRNDARERTPSPLPRAGPAELRGKRKPPNSANPPTPNQGQPSATVAFDVAETFDGGGPAGEADRRSDPQRRTGRGVTQPVHRGLHRRRAFGGAEDLFGVSQGPENRRLPNNVQNTS